MQGALIFFFCSSAALPGHHTRVATVSDVTKSDYMTLSSDIKTGIRIRDFVHEKLGFRLSSVFEMTTLDSKSYGISYSESRIQ